MLRSRWYLITVDFEIKDHLNLKSEKIASTMSRSLLVTLMISRKVSTNLDCDQIGTNTQWVGMILFSLDI